MECSIWNRLDTQWGAHVSTGAQLKKMRAATSADVAMARSTGLSAQSALYITDSVVWARVSWQGYDIDN